MGGVLLIMVFYAFTWTALFAVLELATVVIGRGATFGIVAALGAIWIVMSVPR